MECGFGIFVMVLPNGIHGGLHTKEGHFCQITEPFTDFQFLCVAEACHSSSALRLGALLFKWFGLVGSRSSIPFSSTLTEPLGHYTFRTPVFIMSLTKRMSVDLWFIRKGRSRYLWVLVSYLSAKLICLVSLLTRGN